MMTIPLQPVPTQRVTVTLAGQPCAIDVETRRTGLFLNLFVNSAPIVTGVICEDRNALVREAYLGFVGDLAFFDTHATAPDFLDGQDPTFDGLGDRYLLVYIEAADLA